MPYYGYYGIDMYYIVLVLPCVLFAFWAQNKVNSTFNRYSRVQNLRGLTGAQAAEAVLRYNGVSGVRIEYVSGKLTDHFDPRSNVIRLSSAVYSSTSVASIGVAAHEAGHAVQYAIGYAPIKLRAAIIPLTQFGSMAAMPLLILGLILNTSTARHDRHCGVRSFHAVPAGDAAGGAGRIPPRFADHSAERPADRRRVPDGEKDAHGGGADLCCRAGDLAGTAAASGADFWRKRPQ